MGALLPATWIIAIASIAFAAVGMATFVAMAAYKIGKVAGRLKEMDVQVAKAVPPTSSTSPKEETPSVAPSEIEKKEAPDEDTSSSSDEEEPSGTISTPANVIRVITPSSFARAIPSKITGEKTGRKSTEKKEVKGENKRIKSKEKKKKVKDDDWEWPIYDSWWSNITGAREKKLREKIVKVKSKHTPFEVTYEQRKSWPDTVTVTLRSEHLKQAAKQCLPEHKDLGIEHPKLNAQELFLALQSFKKVYQSSQEDDTSLAKCQLKHLLRFLETEYKDTIVHLERTQREKTASWDLLWATYPKQQKVYYTCSMTGQMLLGVVRSVHYIESMQGKFLVLSLEVRDYHGRKYVKGSVRRLVEEFNGEKSFESIGIYPMALVEQPQQLEAMFLQNGKKFYELVTRRSCYMQYEGPRMRMELVGSCWELKKQKADGRVMVDLLSFARMNPGYPLNNAEPPACCNPQRLTCSNEQECMPSDEELMLAPAVVYGFSFAIKQWGGFDVNGFSEIWFDDSAFDRDLVLTEPTRKKMLMSLVSQYLKDAREADNLPKVDPIANKGDGCIFLCYGPPGTGKTLTAESIAEKLHRPLWAVSVFELGTTANDLETTLMDILDIASQWRAVLLLDEADIYLEKRTSNADPNRTAMTAIFLRLLEYYRGVLFLTTNRVASFDDAFCSRISMFLRYHRLSGAQRSKVWGNLLVRAGVQDPDIAPFADAQLNGREIRNTIRIAQNWANSSGEELTVDHVLQVVHMLDEFREDLEGAINDEVEERTISRALTKMQSLKGSSLCNGNA